MRLSIRQTERGARLPTASFIIICLGGSLESGQTEQTPSIFRLLFTSFFLFSFVHDTSISLLFSLSNLLVCPVRILSFPLLVLYCLLSLSLVPIALPSSISCYLQTDVYHLIILFFCLLLLWSILFPSVLSIF